ncbi:MAG TPA: ATP synthase F0 subunit B [Candidatus Binataceae bacterium]|jgi:F-type H+-transporting ATPase subunit b|nr:ATP synthase F0 subunit B [Candidatus Binataceae bacterium]
MKRRILIAASLSTALMPSAALAAEGAAESSGSWTSLLFYIINFAIFVVILVKYAVPMARDFFNQRATSIADSLAKAETNYHQAEELANRAAERTAKLESEKTQIASDLADETVYQIGRIYEIAQETATRIKRDTELSAAATREAGQRRMRQVLAAAAGRLARETVVREFQPEDQDRLLDNFVAKLRDEAR